MGDSITCCAWTPALIQLNNNREDLIINFPRHMEMWSLQESEAGGGPEASGVTRVPAAGWTALQRSWELGLGAWCAPGFHPDVSEKLRTTGRLMCCFPPNVLTANPRAGVCCLPSCWRSLGSSGRSQGWWGHRSSLIITQRPSRVTG